MLDRSRPVHRAYSEESELEYLVIRRWNKPMPLIASAPVCDAKLLCLNVCVAADWFIVDHSCNRPDQDSAGRTSEHSG